jgi:dTDP-glucose pyrophosphorylase
MSSPVFGILPAAGRGARVAGLGWRKWLYPVGWESASVDGTTVRRPRVVASYTIDAMIRAGAERLFVVVGEGGEVMQYFGGGRGGTPIAYLVQDEPRGGAFAIDLARAWLPERHTVLFGFPDTIVEPADAFVGLLSAHREAGADLTLGLFPTDRPQQFGMVRLDGDRPVEIVDKPRQTDLRLMWGQACWGERVTALQAGLLAGRPRGREVVPGEIFEAALASGLDVRARVFEEGCFLDVGTPAGLNEALETYGGRTLSETL